MAVFHKICLTNMKVFFGTLFLLSSCVMALVPIRSIVDSPGVVNLTHTEQLEIVKHLTESSFISRQLVYRAQQGYRVSIHIQSLNIHRTSAGAVDQGLDIFDGSSIRPENRLTEKTLYGNYPYPATVSADSSPAAMFKDYTSSGRDILIIIYAYLTPENPGFNITAVPFMLPVGGQCPEKHFLCVKNKRCIMQTCLCDETADCGLDDISDEEQCPVHVSDEWKIVPLSAAVGIFGGIIIALIVVVLIWVCRKKQVVSENEETTSEPIQETINVTNDVYEPRICPNESEEQFVQLHHHDRDDRRPVQEEAETVEQRDEELMLLSWSRDEGNPLPATGGQSLPPQYDGHAPFSTDDRSLAPAYASRDPDVPFTPPGLPPYMSNVPPYKVEL